MRRPTRIVLEVLGPPLLGACLLNGFGIAWDLLTGTGWSFIWLQRHDYLVVIFWAYLLGALPSVGYMGLMEWRFSQGLDPRSAHMVHLSLTLGLIAGMSLGALVGSLFSGSVRQIALGAAGFGFAGLLVGLLLGFLIRRCSPVSGRARQDPSESGRGQSETGPTGRRPVCSCR